MVKKAAKAYGIRNWIEGVCDQRLSVLLVDDVVGSGKTLTTQAGRLERLGLEVIGAFCVASCKRKVPFDMANDSLGIKPLKVEALFGPGDFSRLHVEYARKYGKEPQFCGTVI